MHPPDFLILALAGFVASLILFPIAIFLGQKFNLVDQPGGRKKHDGAIPLIGGLVIIPVFAMLVYLSGLHHVLLLAPLLGAVLLLLVMGALDDKFHIHPWARFLIQILLAGYVVIFAGAEIEALGNLWGFGDVHLGWFGKIFSVTCLVLLMNAINMLDGMDGLCAGFVAVAMTWLMVAALGAGFGSYFWAMAFILAPLLAFLVFNMRHPLRKSASVFLGDAGSLCLALILGWFAIHLAQETAEGVQAIPAVVIIWIMSVPIIDTFAIFFVRMKQGRSPFDADRLHIHHKFQDFGIDIKWATPLILLLSFVMGGIGYIGYKLGVPDYVLLYSWSVIWIGYTAYRLKYAKQNTPKPD